MDKKTPRETKYFKYKLSPVMIVLSVLVLILAVAGMGVSIYRIVRFRIREFNDALQSPLLILVCVLLIAIVTGILVKSQYIVTDQHYITQFGFIKSKFLIKDVTSIELNMDTNKLTVYVGEQYSVLSMSPEWNEDFVRALRDVNPNIDYTFTYNEKKDKDDSNK